jgi:hypothetical protein
MLNDFNMLLCFICMLKDLINETRNLLKLQVLFCFKLVEVSAETPKRETHFLELFTIAPHHILVSQFMNKSLSFARLSDNPTLLDSGLDKLSGIVKTHLQ